MADAVLFALMVLTFAAFVTVHLVLVAALTFAHRPRWRGVAALVLPPLAAIWGWRAGRKRSVVLWGSAIVLYALVRLIAFIGLGR
ncbi:MAG: hypothetical protein HOW73_27710 [Polyangiaceae bacterium]|nr:hypothetical protein [Polyangiaceae bacterium]